MPQWLNPEQYRLVQASVPIVCVDIVPLKMNGSAIDAIGLILRDTPHQGRRWCLVGGRVLRDESLAQAAARHLRETLGNAIRFSLDPDIQPVYVSQYFPTPRPPGVLDPRQHSVAMNYLVPIEGEVRAGGEAHQFQWFPPTSLPTPTEFGFQQDLVLAECLRRAR